MPIKMEITELARMLKTAPGTIERWIRQGRIPVRQKGNSCEFSRSALKKWADTHHMTFNANAPQAATIVEMPPESLLAAMQCGGVLYDVEGRTAPEVLGNAVASMDSIGGDENKSRVIRSLMDREEMMSTGIGKGVAVPHPRSPLPDLGIPALITTCFLSAPVDFNALDRKPVFVLFILMAPSAKHHLHLLARLSFCLRDDDFIAFLRRVPKQDAFYKFINAFEHETLSGG